MVSDLFGLSKKKKKKKIKLVILIVFLFTMMITIDHFFFIRLIKVMLKLLLVFGVLGKCYKLHTHKSV